MAHERRPHLNPPPELLAAVLRGEADATGQLAGLDPDDVCRCARHHAVVPLLAEQIAGRADVPPALASRLRDDANRHLAVDLARERDLRRCLEALHRAGVAAVVIKGAHLAYRYYRRPDLRPRVDSDVLIAREGRHDADRALVECGYERRDAIGGELLTSQALYVRRDGERVSHALDVHWRLSNPQVFADVLTFDEISRDAEPVPALSPVARGLSPVHALLVACVHRVAHHYDTDCLIWIYDIHLIASSFGADDWQQFQMLAVDRSMVAVCRQGLMRARVCFGTTWPPAVDAAWASERVPEAATAYLASDRRLAAHLWIDLRALPTWASRWQLLREQVFPPARYMREVYAPDAAAPLPFLYARRVVQGARKWLVRF